MTDKVGRIEFGPHVGYLAPFGPPLKAGTVVTIDAENIQNLANEVTRLRQGLWDVYRELGGDCDGDATPAALVSDLVPLVLELAKETRAELDERIADAYHSGIERDLAE